MIPLFRIVLYESGIFVHFRWQVVDSIAECSFGLKIPSKSPQQLKGSTLQYIGWVGTDTESSYSLLLKDSRFLSYGISC